ncbi:uncharacterized protein B0I36DRAFT_359138 [Microdochium trichocladiopsis]|uniref:Roadblock/LAMTOR2 domain-containing protein n=1 Tax=Microdochium trichocladiopsis TaxID=1682393 RepID=A0A9P8YDP8_9PEZI|nr:uncharacterized protein B0I36DRAFT_359138 [Microdochium trichocladiopsis]KAH7037443.1 hypothetical protein B0I36DRAFT_359138 [Microdochium trichocladiopsis]
MADKSLPTSNSDSIDEALHRLSRKPGVKAWLMLDRTTGAVLKTNGHISSIRPARKTTGSQNSSANPLQIPSSGSFSADVVPSESESEAQAAQELASLVWNFITSAGALVDDMDSDDELKLLRLRMKKQELVIVPEAKYLLVVSHDTPPV